MFGPEQGGFRIPQLGQQQKMQHQMAHQMVVGCYLSLIPVVAQTVLAQSDLYADRDQIPDRIADEAWRVTAAAMKKVGIQVNERPEGKPEPE